MFRLESELLEKIKNKITVIPLEIGMQTAAKSCGDNCNGNCDDIIKKKPH